MSACNEQSSLNIGKIFHTNDNDFWCVAFIVAKSITILLNSHCTIKSIISTVELDSWQKTDLKISETKLIDNRVVKWLEESDVTNDEFAFLERNFELFDEPIDAIKLESADDHIVLEPTTELNTEPMRFIEGTDYEQQNNSNYLQLLDLRLPIGCQFTTFSYTFANRSKCTKYLLYIKFAQKHLQPLRI